MDQKKVQLGPHAFSYAIEVDLEDLDPNLTLTERYEKYCKQEQEKNLTNKKSDHRQN